MGSSKSVQSVRQGSALSYAVVMLATSGALLAQPYGRPPALKHIGIEQKLNAQVPMNLTFTDEHNEPVRLGQYFAANRPVVLSLVYYQCPMLCNMVLNGELSSLKHVGLKLGEDYEVVTVSFDPKETPQLALTKKAIYIEKFGRFGKDTGWHFLTGSEPQIRALADAVGFRYQWDDVTKQWAHASGIMILTPEGKVSRYFYGINYPHQDMRLGLVEASANKIGSPVDQILLFCYHYDPTTGKYGFAILNTLRAAGTATALGLGIFVFTMIRREKNAKV